MARDDTEIDAAPSDGQGPDCYSRSTTVGFSLCSMPVRLRLSQLPISMVRPASGSAVQLLGAHRLDTHRLFRFDKTSPRPATKLLSTAREYKRRRYPGEVSRQHRRGAIRLAVLASGISLQLCQGGGSSTHQVVSQGLCIVVR